MRKEALFTEEDTMPSADALIEFGRGLPSLKNLELVIFHNDPILSKDYVDFLARHQQRHLSVLILLVQLFSEFAICDRWGRFAEDSEAFIENVLEVEKWEHWGDVYVRVADDGRRIECQPVSLKTKLRPLAAGVGEGEACEAGLLASPLALLPVWNKVVFFTASNSILLSLSSICR